MSMNAVKEKFNALIRFWKVDIWQIENEESEKNGSVWYRILRLLAFSVREFIHSGVQNRASALTYNTLLAFIPIAALLFSLARGFGLADLLETQLHETLAGHDDTIRLMMQFVDSYLIQAQNGIFIGLGLVMLFWTTFRLTTNIEQTFNYIWQIKHERTLYRKFTDYFSMLLLLPLLLVLSSGISIFMTTMLQHLEPFALLQPIVKLLVKLSPFVLMSAIFTGLYIFMPNTSVKWRHAILPGTLAGVAFQGFQYIYITSQIGVAKYNAIYGSFAAIPLFLLWAQISWTICLFGAQLCYVSQNLGTYIFALETKHISRRYHDFLCILIMSLICKRFAKGEQPYTAESLSRENKMPLRLTKNILYELQDLRLIHEGVLYNEDELTVFLPSVDIQRMSITMLMQRLDTHGNENLYFKMSKYKPHWEAINTVKKACYASGREILLKDL